MEGDAEGTPENGLGAAHRAPVFPCVRLRWVRPLLRQSIEIRFLFSVLAEVRCREGRINSGGNTKHYALVLENLFQGGAFFHMFLGLPQACPTNQNGFCLIF